MRWRKPAKRTDHDALHFPGTPGWRLLYQVPKNLTRPLDFLKLPGSDSEMSRRIRHDDAYFVTQRF
jgi:hypothetical protein